MSLVWSGGDTGPGNVGILYERVRGGRIGNDFIASVYRKELWRPRAETSNLSCRSVGGALPLGCNLHQEVTEEGR